MSNGSNQGNSSGSSFNAFAKALGSEELVGQEETLSSATEESADVVHSQNSIVDDLQLGETEDTRPDSPESQDPALASKEPEAKSKVTSEKEVITVTDETGRKRKVEIDYSNRDAIKKTYAMAAGMRKFQAERDQALSSRKDLEGKLSEREKDWNTLEGAFQQGPEALFDLLSGRKGAFDEHVQKRQQRADFMKNASPEEIEALKSREQADLTRRELDKIRKENEEFRKSVSEEREQAETRALESRVHPVFEKYRFADKLGNSGDEHMFDEMLWNSALKRLEPYEEKGLNLSPDIIEREFKSVAQAIRNRIGVQAEKKVSKTIDQKKQEATENVQAKLKSSYTKDGDSTQLKKLIQNGDTGGIFRNWSTFSKLLSNKR